MVSAMSSQKESTYTNIPTLKILLWISMVSMVMMFAGLTSGYIVRQAEGNWFQFELPLVFYVSTAFILMSSFSMQWAMKGVKRGQGGQLRTGLIITLGLGLAFTFTQFAAWSKLVDMGVYFTGNPSGSFLYVLTALHLAHVVGGILFLMVVTARSIQGKYNKENHLPVELCTIFWHFLDGLWIYLFFFLTYIR